MGGDVSSIFGGLFYKEGEVVWDIDWYEFWDKSEWFGCLVKV